MNNPLWNDQQADKKPLVKTKFYDIQKGNNIVRFVSDPYKAKKYNIDNKHFVNVSKDTELNLTTTLPVKEQIHFYAAVLDRSDDTIKVLDFGQLIYTGIQALVNDADWGDPIGYDINIIKNPDGGASTYYRVAPKPRRPLSASELVAVENFDMKYLERLANPDKEYMDKQIAKLPFEAVVVA